MATSWHLWHNKLVVASPEYNVYGSLLLYCHHLIVQLHYKSIHRSHQVRCSGIIAGTVTVVVISHQDLNSVIKHFQNSTLSQTQIYELLLSIHLHNEVCNYFRDCQSGSQYANYTPTYKHSWPIFKVWYDNVTILCVQIIFLRHYLWKINKFKLDKLWSSGKGQARIGKRWLSSWLPPTHLVDSGFIL